MLNKINGQKLWVVAKNWFEKFPKGFAKLDAQ